MRVLLSGEGPTDLGCCTNAQGQCEGDDFKIGPMTVLLAQAAEPCLGYDLLTTPGCLMYVGESELCVVAKGIPRRLLPTRGKKHGAETGYFYSSAMALGMQALELGAQLNEPVLAVLFRDSDGTRSSPSTLWANKIKSMRDGFALVECNAGVPMVPKPKSEVWLLCAAQPEVLNCEPLEDISGNDNAPNSAKDRLDAVFEKHKSGDELCDWLTEQPADMVRLQTMPSFEAFHEDLDRVLNHLLH
jgi:hypothetical protein